MLGSRPRLPAVAGFALAVVLGTGVAPASAATDAAPPVTSYQVPFRCGQTWTGTTRPDHSPSPDAVDFTRSNDFGMPVVAAASGTVVVAKNLGRTSYGRYVVIDHGNGESTLYAHLSRIYVTRGQYIDQGSLLGRVGASGDATGPHLHFEERLDGTDVPPYFDGVAYQFGTSISSRNCVDVPVVGDWNGDGTPDIGVYRRGRGHGRFLMLLNGTTTTVKLGSSTDAPVLGDWNGNGTTDLGARDAVSRALSTRAGDGTVTTTTVGGHKDQVVSGDFAGDGTTEVAVYRPKRASFGLPDDTGKLVWTPVGSPGEIPVVGDWNGDGTDDFGVYDPSTSTWTLRYVDAAGIAWVAEVGYGQPGDLPVVGDWNGDGSSDLGVWTPSTATWTLDPVDAASPPTDTAASPTPLVFGRTR